MNARQITSKFGRSAEDDQVEELFSQLGTLKRPSLPEDDKYVYHDWVLVRRKGVELGFTDSAYQSAAPRSRWGHGELILTQAYFYTGFDDIQPFTGELPYGLLFSDNRETVRRKLTKFDATRHSHVTDTWDVEGYRLRIQYVAGAKEGIDRIACRVMAQPLQPKYKPQWPTLQQITDAFGARLDAPEFTGLWGNYLGAHQKKEAREDGEIDFKEIFGATLALAEDNATAPVFRSITLHRNRDSESVGWGGSLPANLDFEDSPETLFSKIKQSAVQQADSALTGHAVWHFPDYTLHVLYSNIDNRLLRVKLISPGSWKCIEDE